MLKGAYITYNLKDFFSYLQKTKYSPCCNGNIGTTILQQILKNMVKSGDISAVNAKFNTGSTMATGVVTWLHHGNLSNNYSTYGYIMRNLATKKFISWSPFQCNSCILISSLSSLFRCLRKAKQSGTKSSQKQGMILATNIDTKSFRLLDPLDLYVWIICCFDHRLHIKNVHIFSNCLSRKWSLYF